MMHFIKCMFGKSMFDVFQSILNLAIENTINILFIWLENKDKLVFIILFIFTEFFYSSYFTYTMQGAP